MNYIISKLDVYKLKMEIIYASETEEDCKAKLLDLVQKNTNINKVIENDYIMTYKQNKGYIYNNKTLDSIYQILRIKTEENDYDY